MEALPFSAKTHVRLPPETLWTLLSDTDRLNRAMHMPPVSFSPSEDRTQKGHYTATMPLGPLKLTYEEHPFDWVENRHFQVLRLFKNGPFSELVMALRLQATDDGTTLHIEGHVRPRNSLGWVLGKTVIQSLLTREIFAMAHRYALHAKTPETHPSPVLPPMHLIYPSQLTACLALLKTSKVNLSLIDRLVRLIQEGSDLNVSDIRPFVLADTWGVDRMEVLQLLLFATKAHLMDLKWVVLCPNCMAPSAEPKSLAFMKAEAHCDTCEIRYGADFSTSIEARFTVNPAVRLTKSETYCIGGPANHPDTIAQLRLKPGETRIESMVLKPGPLRLMCYQTPGSFEVNVQNNANTPTKLRIRCETGGFSVAPLWAHAGPSTISIVNTLLQEALIVLQKETWAENAASAALITSLQDFKDLFPEEAVAPGEEIAISSLAILFTDLSASTLLYQNAGDAKAFGMIRNHFEYVTDAVRNRGGGMVKMMGDAVMATFSSSRQALEAAFDMQAHWTEFAAKHQIPEGIALKIGIHAGRCIAVNNQGKMDYFGTTINIAARVESEAKPHDIIITQSVFEERGVQSFLTQWHLPLAPAHVTLRGIAEDQVIYRITPTTSNTK
jgi:adenylate cyclase